MNELSEIFSTTVPDRAMQLAIQKLTDGAVQVEFETKEGLYQFSVIADARDFNWAEAYIPLHLFGNKGQRTGPWDFNLLDGNKPLVPSYWVFLNGRKLGLWFFQRVSVEDIEHRRFRGRMAFRVATAGKCVLKLLPYRSMKLRWMSARLEPDPEDRLLPIPFYRRDSRKRSPAAFWGDPKYWRGLRKKLATTHSMYAKPLGRAFDWASKGEHSANVIPFLVAAYRLGDREEAQDMALRAIDKAVALPHWGNPKEDGYSHDGDMGAAHSLRTLAWAYHALNREMGEDRRERLKEKLALQGSRFFELALLNRDYWGGSLLQDHGRKSILAFGAASLNLLGVLPNAEVWTSFILLRARRGLEAMPRDGTIPPSSYCNLYMYLDELTDYRDALLSWGGGDLLDEFPFRSLIDYLIAVAHPREHLMIVSSMNVGDAIPLIGGNAFLNRMASKFKDGRAAYLQRLLLETPKINFYHPMQECAFYAGALWGFLSYNPEVLPCERLPKPRRMSFFEDSGLAHYRDDRNGVTLSVRCGPWCGYHAYRHAQGPCDRMGGAPAAGHFSLALGSRLLLVTPDCGYQVHSGLGSCLLVDGKGQRDDVGYPMSIPSKLHYGEEIQRVDWDEKSGTGVIALNLAPAYPREMGVAAYAREFIFSKERRIICRDHVVLNEPHRLSWLFQGKRENGLGVERGMRVWFGKNPRLRLEARPYGVDLKVKIYETRVVWAYASTTGFKPFDHARFESRAPCAGAIVDFVLTW